MGATERNRAAEQIVASAGDISRNLLFLAPKSIDMDSEKQQQRHLDEAGDHVQAIVTEVQAFQEIAG